MTYRGQKDLNADWSIQRTNSVTQLFILNSSNTIISVVVIIDRVRVCVRVRVSVTVSVNVTVTVSVTVNGCNMFDVTFVFKVLGQKHCHSESLENNPALYEFAQKMARDRSTSVTDHLLAFPGLTPLPFLFPLEKNRLYLSFELCSFAICSLNSHPAKREKNHEYSYPHG